MVTGSTMRDWIRRVLGRCLTDLKLANVLLLGVVTSVVIIPFGVYRALNLQWGAALLDAALVAVILSCVVYALRSDRSDRAGAIIVVCVAGLVVAMAATTGIISVLWSFVPLVGNFMVANRRVALGANIGLIGGLLLVPGSTQSVEQMLVFAVVATLVTIYAYGFAWLTAHQRSKLELLASRDPLTGVPNRRALELELGQTVASHLRAGLPAGVAMLDIDHFKSVNDQHGHDAGDRVLIAFVATVQRGLRKRDVLYRYGGEEFVLLLPATDAAGVEHALEKTIARVRAELRGARGEAITCSVGAAMLQPGDDASAWLARSDTALYRAKHSGRDRLCMHHAGDDKAPERRS